jgi:hypothetical protein
MKASEILVVSSCACWDEITPSRRNEAASDGLLETDSAPPVFAAGRSWSAPSIGACCVGWNLTRGCANFARFRPVAMYRYLEKRPTREALDRHT